MKKTLYSTILSLSLILTSNLANAQAFDEGKSYVSAGYGIGSYFASLYNSIKNSTGVTGYKVTSLGPIYGKYEYAVSEHIGLGINFAYLGNKISYEKTEDDGNGNVDTYKWKLDRTTVSFLARMNIHFGDHEKFDPYWGFGVGYRTANWKSSYEVVSTNSANTVAPTTVTLGGTFPLGFETTAGVRYFIIPSLAVYAEAGLAKSYLQLGLTGKF